MSNIGNQEPLAETPAKSGTPPSQVTPAALSSAQIEDLKTRAAKADENWDRLLRTTADFENFKKRAAREKTETAQYANVSLVQKLLPVLDNFEMALTAATAVTGTKPAASGIQDDKLASLQSGVKMIQQQMRNALLEAGLEEIDAAGKAFDPNFHEAISQQESADLPEGHVLQQLRKGYKLKDRLLRPATVIVARKPAPGSK